LDAAQAAPKQMNTAPTKKASQCHAVEVDALQPATLSLTPRLAADGTSSTGMGAGEQNLCSNRNAPGTTGMSRVFRLSTLTCIGSSNAEWQRPAQFGRGQNLVRAWLIPTVMFKQLCAVEAR